MSAYVVFVRTKTIDQKELEKYWVGIRATMKGHPKDWYYNEAYQSVARHRKQGAIYNGLIVEGVN